MPDARRCRTCTYEMPRGRLYLKHEGATAVLPDGAKLSAYGVVGMPHILVTIGERTFIVDATEAMRGALAECGYDADALMPVKSESDVGA